MEQTTFLFKTIIITVQSPCFDPLLPVSNVGELDAVLNKLLALVAEWLMIGWLSVRVCVLVLSEGEWKWVVTTVIVLMSVVVIGEASRHDTESIGKGTLSVGEGGGVMESLLISNTVGEGSGVIKSLMDSSRMNWKVESGSAGSTTSVMTNN